MKVTDQQLQVVRRQSEAMAKIGRGRNKVLLNAPDAAVLLDLALASDRAGRDQATANYWRTLQRQAKAKEAEADAKRHQTRMQAAHDNKAPHSIGACLPLSNHDFRSIVDAAESVARQHSPRINYPDGSGAGGDGARPMKMEPVRDNTGDHAGAGDVATDDNTGEAATDDQAGDVATDDPLSGDQ